MDLETHCLEIKIKSSKEMITPSKEIKMYSKEMTTLFKVMLTLLMVTPTPFLEIKIMSKVIKILQ